MNIGHVDITETTMLIYSEMQLRKYCWIRKAHCYLADSFGVEWMIRIDVNLVDIDEACSDISKSVLFRDTISLTLCVFGHGDQLCKLLAKNWRSSMTSS